MNCTQDSLGLVLPGPARVLGSGQVNPTPAGSGQVNPTPAAYEDSDMLVERYLSPEKLKSLSDTEDLAQVTSLEMCVDTRESTLGNFGAYLPRLVQLRLNNSTIASVRDLGTTLAHLQVLWMCRCGLVDLDGIPSLSSLKELHVAYNQVVELSPVSMLEHLEVLDLEGNAVEDLVQVQILGLCSRLSTLTLQGNPVCLRPHPRATQAEEAEHRYRGAVRELLPQLRYLDDARAEEEEGPGGGRSMEDDWALLREMLTMQEETAYGVHPRPVSAPLRPGPALYCPSRPPSARPPSSSSSSSSSSCSSRLSRGSRPGSADSDPAPVDPDASALTHGAGRILFCGNPVQALRARRQKNNMAPLALEPPPLPVPEPTFDPEEPDGGERRDVMSELRAWREQHSKRLLAIERDGPRVMTSLSDDDEEEEEEEEASLSLAVGEEEEEGRMSHWTGPASSPDSSFQTPSPDVFLRASVSPDVARLSLSPDSTLSPSPPPGPPAPPAGRRPPGPRARRLRLPRAGREEGVVEGRSSGGAEPDGGELQRVQRTAHLLQRPQTAHLLQRPQTAHLPRRPASSPLGPGLRDPRREVGVSTGGHQPIASRGPPGRTAVITRPLTARAALQRPPAEGALT